MADLLINGLSKSFGRQSVLQDVGLAVGSGRLTAILGRSGSGKTTLLRVVCGFERVDAGSVAIGGQIVSSRKVMLPPEHRRIGYVAQEGALFPHLTVAENLVFGLPRGERRAHRRAGELLELVGLSAAYERRWPHALSGGEQQRVALARALAPAPRLVLLDEPFSSLDATLRAETRDAVVLALRRAGATALLVTHDQAEALSVGQDVAVLRAGRIVQVASPDRLYQQPIDAELARFVGEAVLLPGHAAAGHGRCALGTIPLRPAAPAGAVDVMLRPEQLQLVSPRRAPLPEAQVTEVTFHGPTARVRLTLHAEGGAMELVAAVPGHMAPAIGETVGVAVTGEAIAFARGPAVDARAADAERAHLAEAAPRHR